ncbi:dienelactone hydrolase family protein [Arsukibacterium sp.]|uniref:dienelactone hydrolase family protein n=1 Tax=Arsukibacterium sp. TaxID=1977258 RepID=UPI002FDB2082
MRLLIVTDIFGVCIGLSRLLQDLAAVASRVQLVDPYHGQAQHFADEQQAYAAYSAQCGHNAYGQCVASALQTATAPFDFAIGFSAGASALWRALAQADADTVKQAILFYPGQIYQHLALTPQLPVQVVFGHSEPHFAVADICSQLQQQPGVTAVSTNYAHGFMNPASQAFSEAGYQQQLSKLLSLLSLGAGLEL